MPAKKHDENDAPGTQTAAASPTSAAEEAQTAARTLPPEQPSAADQRHADALAAKAEKAEERAEAAQEKAEELAQKAEAAAKAAEDAGGPKDDHCPDCGTRLQHYEGENPHKLGQGYCRKCQARKPLGR